MKLPILAGVLAPCLLAGCQHPCLSSLPPRHASLSASPVSRQAAPPLALALTEDGWRLPGRITANSQRVSVDWDGDAIELLSQLAHQRGVGFRYTGVRLPLPVTLHEHDTTFDTLLRLIRAQIHWRATLTQQADALEVGFMPPLQGRLS